MTCDDILHSVPAPLTAFQIFLLTSFTFYLLICRSGVKAVNRKASNWFPTGNRFSE